MQLSPPALRIDDNIEEERGEKEGVEFTLSITSYLSSIVILEQHVYIVVSLISPHPYG